MVKFLFINFPTIYKHGYVYVYNTHFEAFQLGFWRTYETDPLYVIKLEMSQKKRQKITLLAYINRSVSQMLLVNWICTLKLLANRFMEQLWHLRVVAMIFPFKQHRTNFSTLYRRKDPELVYGKNINMFPKAFIERHPRKQFTTQKVKCIHPQRSHC